MNRRTLYNKSKRLRNISIPIISSALALGIIFLIILFFSYIITKIDANDLMLSVMSTVALCIGAYVGGYVSGKRRKRNGLLMGVLCGVFIFLIIVVLSSIFAKTVKSFSMPVKLIVTLVSAGLGGIVGVNSKDRRY